MSNKKLAEYKLKRGIELYKKGHKEEALQTLMRSLDHFTYGETEYYIGKIYLEQNFVQQARHYLQSAAKLYAQEFAEGHGANQWIEDYQDLSLNLGEVFLRLNEPNKAKQVLENARNLYVVNNIGNIKRIQEMIERADTLDSLLQIASQKTEPEDSKQEKKEKPSSDPKTPTGQNTKASSKLEQKVKEILSQKRVREKELKIKPQWSLPLKPPAKADLFGKIGLQNLGNTCYMSSTLQCIVGISELVHYFTGDHYNKHRIWDGTYQVEEEDKKDLKPKDDDIPQLPNPDTFALIKHSNGILPVYMAELMKELWFGEAKFTAPDGFRNTFTSIVQHFQGSQQQDASEFLMHFLDIMSNDLNAFKYPQSSKKKPKSKPKPIKTVEDFWKNYQSENNSIITQLFTGLLFSDLKCDKCKKSYGQPEVFSILPLELPSSQQIFLKYYALDLKSETLTPLQFKIRFTSQEGLQKSVILNKARKVLASEFKGKAELPDSHYAIYEEYQENRQTQIRKYDEKIGLDNEYNAILIYQHRDFALAQDQVHHLPVVFMDRSLGFSTLTPILDTVVFPVKFDQQMKSVEKMIKEYEKARRDGTERKKDKELIEKGLRKKAVNLFIVNNLPMKQDKWGMTKKTEACEFCMRSHGESQNCSLENLDTDAMMGQVLAEMKYPREFIISAKYVSYFESVEIKKFRQTVHANQESGRGGIELGECFKNYLRGEPVQDFICHSCKQRGFCKKWMSIRRSPRVLAIQLKRFMMKSSKLLDFSKMAKNSISILFPLEIDLKEIIETKSLLNKKQSLKYQLIGVVYHSGSLQSGHYYSRRKAPDEKGKMSWFLYNDTQVQVSTEQDLQESEAYILFYKAI